MKKFDNRSVLCPQISEFLDGRKQVMVKFDCKQMREKFRCLRNEKDKEIAGAR
jgi:hypothetical protein